MKDGELDRWVNAYIAYQDDPNWNREDHPLFWATEWFMLIPDGPTAEECWLGILEVLRRKPSERVLGMLAAGALEDLIESYGPQFVDRIEIQARTDPAFKQLLLGVWEASTPAVWERVEAARGAPQNAA